MAGGQVAFMSYARFDNDQYDGQISEFRRLLSAEVKAQTGQEFEIFEDREHISWGQNWQEVIDEALDTVALLIVIITPGYFRSEACRAEVARFWQRERDLGRSDLILPVYYISAKEIEEPAARRADEVASMLASRQFVDWRDLRLEPVDSPVVRKAIAALATRMRTAFWRTPQAPQPPARPSPRGGDEWQARPAIAADPGGLQYERRAWQQPAQPFQGAIGSADTWSASPAPAFLPKWDGSAQHSPATAGRPPAVSGTSYPGGAGGARPAAQPRQRVLAFPPNRRTGLAAVALAALLALGGTLYAVETTGSGASGPQAGPSTEPGTGRPRPGLPPTSRQRSRCPAAAPSIPSGSARTASASRPPAPTGRRASSCGTRRAPMPRPRR